jgi:hypothetical protein
MMTAIEIAFLFFMVVSCGFITYILFNDPPLSLVFMVIITIVISIVLDAYHSEITESEYGEVSVWCNKWPVVKEKAKSFLNDGIIDREEFSQLYKLKDEEEQKIVKGQKVMFLDSLK